MMLIWYCHCLLKHTPSPRRASILTQRAVGVAVTADGSKVYIANSGDDTVSVIDAGSRKVIAPIDVGTNPFGVAVTPDGKTVYVANQSHDVSTTPHRAASSQLFEL